MPLDASAVLCRVRGLRGFRGRSYTQHGNCQSKSLFPKGKTICRSAEKHTQLTPQTPQRLLDDLPEHDAIAIESRVAGKLALIDDPSLIAAKVTPQGARRVVMSSDAVNDLP